VDAARVPIYLITSRPAITANVGLWLAASAGAVIGTFLGTPILGRIPEPIYRQVVGGMLVVLGLSLLIAVR
jgi:uncharacterized membrane protein YfcA